MRSSLSLSLLFFIVIMDPVKITNTIVYSALDSDSESDVEDYASFFPSFRPLTYSDKQQRNLVELGCAFNPLESYKQKHLFIQPPSHDAQFALKTQHHQDQLKKSTRALLDQKRQRQQDELKAITHLLKQLETDSDDLDDKQFEEELKKQRQLIDEAIKLDSKRQEELATQAKLKAEKAKKEEEEKAAQAKKQKEKEAEDKQKQEDLAKLKQSSATSLEGLKEYEQYYKTIEHYQKNIRPKLQQDAFRKQCFTARRVISRTISQLQHKHSVVLEKYQFLSQHILGIKQQSQDAFEVMLNHLAKAFLSQVKQEIHATDYAAYFLARFAYLMCATVPELKDYLMGRLLKRCPYLIPRYHDDDPSLSPEEMRSRLRYVYSNKEKKIVETFLEHAEHQKCYVMLFGALTQTLPDPGQPENPIPIKHAWIWLARICNMPPREITPFLVHGMLEVAATRLVEAYPNQTPKLFRLIRETICPLYPEADGGVNKASIHNLETFLDDYFKTGRPQCIPESKPAKV
ncbi:GLE1-like protein-domain-containing protein [Blakeslea trispora]|nr:GLE1-like protein-domain-containing protein [Blakeslea trispora]